MNASDQPLRLFVCLGLSLSLVLPRLFCLCVSLYGCVCAFFPCFFGSFCLRSPELLAVHGKCQGTTRVLCSAPLFVPSSASNKTERNGEIVEEASDPTGNSLTKARRDQCSGSALSSASTCCSHQQTPIGLIEWPIGFRQIVVMSVRFAKFGIGLFSVQPSEFGHWCNPSVWLLCPTAFVSKMQASQKSTETNQERERERDAQHRGYERYSSHSQVCGHYSSSALVLLRSS